MAMPTLQQIIGTITGKVAFERTQANFNTIKDAHNGLETTVGPLTSLTTLIKTSIVNAINSLRSEVNEHKAESVSTLEVHGLKIESGTFTPMLKGYEQVDGSAYTTQTGAYYKIGRQVFITVDIALKTKSTLLNGFLEIQGLPFSVGGKQTAVAITYSNINITSGILAGRANSERVVLLNQNINGTRVNLPVSALTDTTIIQCAFSATI